MKASLTLFRDLKRRHYAERYRRRNGDTFEVYGHTVTIPPTVDPNIRYILAKGRPYEAEEVAFAQTVLRPGDPVIELGGSLGVVSRVIRELIGPDAPHVIVEANPDLVPICRANAGGRDKTEIINAAIAYTGEAEVVFARGENAHAGHLATKGDPDTFSAPVIRLGDVVARLPSDAQFTLVSDIEGGELQMFADEPAETFERLAHAVIEIHPRAFQQASSSEDDFMRLTRDKGLVLLDRKADVALFRGPAS